MTLRSQIAIILVVIAIFGAMGFIIKTQHDALEKTKSIEESLITMKQLNDDIVRHQAEYATKKDMESFAKSQGIDLGPIQDDLNKLNAHIGAISVVIANTPGFKGTNIGSTSIVARPDQQKGLTVTCKDGVTLDCPNPDKFNYINNQQNLQLNEPFADGKTIPWGNVGFSAWKKDPWDVNVYPRAYHVGTVIGVDDNNRHTAYSQLWIETQGERHNIQITNAEIVEQYPESKFSFWNPKILLGVGGGFVVPSISAGVAPGIYFSPWSYGKTKYSPDFLFLEIGYAYEIVNQKHMASLIPISYNLKNVIPFVSNTYIGPGVSFSTTKDLMISINLSLAF